MLTPAQIKWIQTNSQNSGYQLNGEITSTHVRAWSGVATVPTTKGKLYFKAALPALIYEVRLTETLYQWGFPVPTVVAANGEDGWLLIEDSGQALRSLIKAEGTLDRWHTAVAQYAQMQIALLDRVDALLAMGIFDRRLSQLPTSFAELLTDTDALLIDQKDGLTTAEYVQLQQLVPEFERLCQRLAAFGIPETLHHDDFHDNNIFVRDEQYIFADWGEACVAHPFFSMIIVLRIAAYILKLDDDDPALDDLLNSYLMQWQAYGTLKTLRTAFDLAQIIGAVNRALTWHTLLSFMDAEERAEEADAVPGWLQEFLTNITIS